MAAKTRLAKTVSDAEAKVKADAESIGTELDSIKSVLPTLKAKAQDIEDGLGDADEVKAQWVKGIETPPLALKAAEEEDEKVAYLLKAYTARVNLLSRRLPPPHALLAEHIAPVIASILPGVEVLTTTAPLNLWKVNVPEGTTAVVLCQSPGLVTNPYTGIMSGTVTAHFIRQALYRPISVDALEKRAREARISLEVSGNVVGDEGGWVTTAGNGNGNQTDPNALVVDTLTIRVDGVMDGLPVIRKVEVSPPVKDMTMRVFAGFQTPGIVTTARLSVDPSPPEGTSFIIRLGSSTAMATLPLATETEIDGERTLTVKQVVNVSNVNPADFVQAMTDVAHGYVGGPAIGMGLLTAVQIDQRPGALAGNNAVEVVLTYKSLTV